MRPEPNGIEQFRTLRSCPAKGQHKVSAGLVRPFPYCLFICHDGREVLVDRSCQPLWQLRNNRVEACDPDEWVEDIKHQTVLFEDVKALPFYQQYR